jgi:DNA-binding CsgD family transcriptional regulator
VKKDILLYGLVGGVLIALLKLIQYRFLLVEHSVEIYAGVVAAIFAVLGIWLGFKLTRTRVEERVVVKEVRVTVPTTTPFTIDRARLDALGITQRELEILQLIAGGLSNREIAERLFVSENTVKTHSSRLFDKLDARRRTQAVQKAKEQGIIPKSWTVRGGPGFLGEAFPCHHPNG